jgi:hypothetical protein
MSLLFMDGFGGQDSANKYDLAANTYTTSITTPRVPGCYYGDFGTVRGIYKTITPSAQVFIGFGWNIELTPWVKFFGDSGATTHLTIMRDGSTGHVVINRGTENGTTIASGTTVLGNDQWFYIEISATISDTVGTVEVRLNGSPNPEVTFTGDTKNAGTSTNIDRVQVYGGNGVGFRHWLSDLYICNSLGTINNTFLGDVAVRTLSPTGNGTDTMLTNSAATQVNNWSYVDEHPYSSTDYVGSSNPGDRDTYQMADLPGGVTTVYGVQLNALAAKNNASLGTAKMVLRSGGNIYYTSTKALSTSYTSTNDIYETDPATSAQWTVGGVNGIETGMEVV